MVAPFLLRQAEPAVEQTCPSLERLNAHHYFHVGGRQLPARCALQRPATAEALDRAPCDCATDDPAGDRAPKGPESQRPACRGAPDGPASDRTFDRAPGGCASDGAASHWAVG